MAIELTTGVPGAGKTLYTVSEVLLRLLRSTVEIDGRAVPRRLCVAGIPDLLIPHELVEVRPIPPDGYVDVYGDIVRRPGEPAIEHVRVSGDRYIACGADDVGALPLPRSVENWWLWMLPADVLVVDECQTVFRPMPSGRRAPAFIRQLEVHRHYGVDMVFITQHPQLVHSSIRALVGQHRHVRRLFGRRAAIVYEWDHCSPPDRVKNASTSVWRYKKSAFGLYKSAQLHTKQRWGTSSSLVLGLVAFLLLPFLWWRAVGGSASAVDESVAVASSAASSVVVGVAPPVGSVERLADPAAGRAVVVFPVLNAGPVSQNLEPYADRGLQIEGGFMYGDRRYGVFGLVQDGRRIATVTLNQLVSAGYAYTEFGPCAGVLRFADRERVLSCAPRGDVTSGVAVLSPAASAPST